LAKTTALNAKNLEALGPERLAALPIEITTGNALAKRRLDAQRGQGIVKRRTARGKQSMAGGNVLNHEFAELTELHKRAWGVIKEIAFGQRTEAGQAFVLRRQEAEVARYRHDLKSKRFH
jgi:hypothetical protein